MSGPVFESQTANGKYSVVRPAMSHDIFTWSHDTSAWSHDTSTWSHDIPMSEGLHESTDISILVVTTVFTDLIFSSMSGRKLC